MKIKNICCVGAGYVGGPTMAVIALKCPHINITVVDSNPDKIKLWNGKLSNLPVFEPGLSEIIKEVRGRNLFFSTEIDKEIDNAEMIFMAVNTPTKTSGEGAGMAADLKYIEACAINIGKVAKTDKIVIEKSTLPVRTAEKIKEILNENNNGINFEILSNPEFLAEGTAINDLFKSDRVLIGGDQTKSKKKAIKSLVEIYSNWIPRDKILTTNVWSSELAKLASNAMLAQRISSINGLSALCETTGADIEELSKAIGMDHRIGPHFLKASVGFGGSCFQKDILNLVYLCQYYGLNQVAEYWHQVVKINDYQKERFSAKIIEGLKGSLKQKKICILGWSFKPETNDSRESPSIYVSNHLIKKGLTINVYDPKVTKERIFSDLKNLWKVKFISNESIQSRLKQINVYNSFSQAINNVDGIAILTCWKEFQKYDWKKLAKSKKIFDGINLSRFSDYSIGKSDI